MATSEDARSKDRPEAPGDHGLRVGKLPAFQGPEVSDFLYMPPFPAEAFDRWLTTEPDDGPEPDDREPPEPDLEDEGMPMFDEDEW